MVALVYLGGGDSAPSNHVERMDPRFVIVVRSAREAPRRMRGALLFAIQVPRGGPMEYVPGTARKSEP